MLIPIDSAASGTPLNTRCRRLGEAARSRRLHKFAEKLT